MVRKILFLKFGPIASPRVVPFILDDDGRGTIAIREAADGEGVGAGQPRVIGYAKDGRVLREVHRVSHHDIDKR
jgi:hypothetical protein